MKRALAMRVGVPLGVYLLLEWLFAFMTETEGLVTPAGRPHVEVLALGIAYLGLRLLVRWLLPGVVSFVVATAALRRWAK